jgi:hypothetical protein
MGAGGALFLILAFVPVIAVMFMTGDFTPFLGANLWFSLGLSFAVGVGAGVTVLSSGLSGASIMLAFVLGFSTTLYVVVTTNALTAIADMPYDFAAILGGFSVFFFVLGVFFIASGQSEK